MALIIHLHLAPVLKNEGWENDITMDLQVGWGRQTGVMWPTIRTGGRLL